MENARRHSWIKHARGWIGDDKPPTPHPLTRHTCVKFFFCLTANCSSNTEIFHYCCAPNSEISKDSTETLKLWDLKVIADRQLALGTVSCLTLSRALSRLALCDADSKSIKMSFNDKSPRTKQNERKQNIIVKVPRQLPRILRCCCKLLISLIVLQKKTATFFGGIFSNGAFSTQSWQVGKSYLETFDNNVISPRPDKTSDRRNCEKCLCLHLQKHINP